MVKIIFSRTGKIKQPYFRIIAIDKQKDPWGKCLENLGSYNPRTKETTLDAERIKYWISKGAQPSATVNNLLITKAVIEGKKQRVSKLSKKRVARMAKETAKKEAEKPKAPVVETPVTEATPQA